jgi:hypothetical protein
MDMRASELRNFLIRRGMNVFDVNNILDRAELKFLALSLLESDLREQRDSEYWKNFSLLLMASLIVVITVTATSYRKCIFEFLKSLNYSFFQKLNITARSFKHKNYFALLFLAVSLLLEAAMYLMQLSVFAGWLLPYSSSLRKFFFPMLSLSSSTILRNIGGPEQKIQTPSVGLDIGPMISMGICGWIAKKCEDRGSQYIIDDMKRKKASKIVKESTIDADEPGTGVSSFQDENFVNMDELLLKYGSHLPIRSDIIERDRAGVNQMHDRSRDIVSLLSHTKGTTSSAASPPLLDVEHTEKSADLLQRRSHSVGGEEMHHTLPKKHNETSVAAEAMLITDESAASRLPASLYTLAMEEDSENLTADDFDENELIEKYGGGLVHWK